MFLFWSRWLKLQLCLHGSVLSDDHHRSFFLLLCGGGQKVKTVCSNYAFLIRDSNVKQRGVNRLPSPKYHTHVTLKALKMTNQSCLSVYSTRRAFRCCNDELWLWNSRVQADSSVIVLIRQKTALRSDHTFGSCLPLFNFSFSANPPPSLLACVPHP